MTHPLAGYRVADFGQFIAGPAVGQALAELGADVIKIEPVDGEPARGAGPFGRAMVRTNNRGKRDLALDLRHPDGLAVGERLVRSADVVIQNMRTDTMARLGLGPERVTELNPRIVYVSITAFGRDAPPDKSGFDVAAQAESGIMSITGEADGPPQRVGFTVVDQATAYVAVNAVLASLLRRERTGVGAIVDTSLLEVAVHAQGPNWVTMFDTGVEPLRCGNGQPGAAPAAEVIEVADGSIVLSAYTSAHWLRLCQAIGRPDMPTDPRFATNADRLANRAALDAAIGDALAHFTMAEAVDFLNARGIVAGAVRTYGQVLDNPDVQRLGIFRSTLAANDAGGTGPGNDASDSEWPTPYRFPGPPYSIRGVEPVPTTPSPTVGEHSQGVLSELGYTAQEIDQLIDNGVVADARAFSRG